MKTVYGIVGVVSLLFLAGCASYIDYGNGRYGVTRVSEERSPFGTNAGFAYLDNCEGKQDPDYHYQKLSFSDCHAITPISSISSQGQGGQIVGGALMGLGFGLGSAFSGASGASASLTSSSIATGGKGH